MSPRFLRAALAPLLVAAAGCGQKPPPPQPPPPKVTVAQPVRRDVTEYREYAGRLDAVESVDIRARVRGFLQKIYFQEGTEVKKGTPLYEIEPDAYRAALESARADVRRLEATLRQATSEAERVTRLRSTAAVSEEEYVARIVARDEAQANLQKARAAVETAQLDLSYTRITAPIDGRINRTLVTEGNLVGYNEPTLLTTLVRMDPVYVYFEAPEGDYLEYRRLMREEGLPTAEQSKTPVYVGLVTDKGYPHQGVIDFRGNRVDPSTGTITLRGSLPNPRRVLVPGLYARVRVPFGKPRPRLLVPQVAVSSDQRGPFLLLVKPDNTVEHRRVTTGEAVGDLTVIESGLKPDEWVVIDGLQKARPGAEVEPNKVLSAES
jgi:multidrug efflux system membrane fusion protein